MALLFALEANAREPGDNYIGFHIGQSTLDVDAVNDIEHTYGLVRFGIFLTRSLALELRYGNDLDDDTVSSVDYSLDRIAGGYAAYHFNFGSHASLYGLLGYSELDLKAKPGGGSSNEDETDTTYGIGLDLGNFNFEFTQYIDRSDYEASAVSLGYTLHFQ